MKDVKLRRDCCEQNWNWKLFGSEGALRFLIRIAREHFTIKFRLDQTDAF